MIFDFGILNTISTPGMATVSVTVTEGGFGVFSVHFTGRVVVSLEVQHFFFFFSRAPNLSFLAQSTKD